MTLLCLHVVSVDVVYACACACACARDCAPKAHRRM
jgi:hypothetical protein